MSSLAIKVPLIRDSGDGYKTIKSFRELIKQNFKMLLLTDRGERVMEPTYGVGLKKFLFEPFTESTFAKMESTIMDQAEIFMPVVSVQEISFEQMQANENGLAVRIVYSIPDIGVKDLLQFTI